MLTDPDLLWKFSLCAENENDLLKTKYHFKLKSFTPSYEDDQRISPCSKSL